MRLLNLMPRLPSGNSMIPAERHKTILALLQQNSVISIQELTDKLSVSHMTIRRDIARLEAEGRVTSVAGGVQLTEHLYQEPSHHLKREHRRGQKQAIGLLAASLIPPHACIYLDAGTTTLEIANALLERDDLCIITNDFVITMLLLGYSNNILYHTGGKVDRDNQSCVGDKTAAALAEFNIDLAFISSSSWNQRGISTPNEDKVAVKRAIVAAAERNYLVCDASKYGMVAPFHAVDLVEFDKIITDQALPTACVDELRARDIDVLVAD